MGIIPLMPQGTNSTMWTECCGVAITDGEVTCPCCHALVIGHDDNTPAERNRTRWYAATRHWKRKH